MSGKEEQFDTVESGEGILKVTMDGNLRTYNGHFFLIDEKSKIIAAGFTEVGGVDRITFQFPLDKLGAEVEYNDSTAVVSYNRDNASFPWAAGKVKVQRDTADNELYFGTLNATFRADAPVEKLEDGIFNIKGKQVDDNA